MPVYQVEDARGRVLELEGDHEPSQSELESAFKSAFPETAPAPVAATPTAPPPDPYNAIGRGYEHLIKSVEPGSFNAAFEPPAPVKRAIDAIAPEFTPGSVAAAVTDELKNAAGAVLSPGGLVLGAAGAAAPIIGGPVASLLAAPVAVEGAKEVYNAKSAAQVAGGLTKATLGTVGVLGGALTARPTILEAIRSKAPATTDALAATTSKLEETIKPTEPTAPEPAPLIDQERIREKAREQDVMPGRDMFASPEFEFRNLPAAEPLITQGIEANLAYKSKVAHTTQQLEALQKTLTPTEQETLTKALFAKESGDTEAINRLPEPAQAAAKSIRETYDTIRTRVIEDKQASVESELSGPQLNALRQVQDGVSLEEAAQANALREGGRAIVESAAQEISDLSKWGIEDYTTHIEKGSYRVVAPDGTNVAIAETRAAAAAKADRWLKENPSVKSVTIDDSFAPGVEFPTKLSQGQYFRLVTRLKDNLGESASEIQRLLHQNGSIVAVKPTNKYAAPLNKRYGILKGEENVFDVLPSYVHTMEKKLALDPVMREARNVLPTLPENARAQVETWLADLKGQKSIVDKAVDYLLRPAGLRPFAYSRGLEVIRNISTHLKLGYRPVAAAVNRISGLQHTWTKTGARYLLEGRQWLKTAEGKATLEANKPYLGIEAAFVHERLRPSSEEPFYKPLGMFQAAERVNRPEAFAAHLKYAEGELGLSGEEAVAFARKATRFGQFVYDSASLPRAMRGPTGRFAFQFKPYLVKELEFISSLRGAEIPRYLAAFLTVGGPRAALVTLKSLPLIGIWAGFDKLDDYLNQKAPAASRGVGGIIGVDVSPSVAFQFPQSTSDFLGPVISDLWKLYTDIVGPAIQGEDRDWSDVRKWASRMAPAANFWGQLVEAASSEGGWITNDRGQPIYKPSKSDYVKLAVGAKPLNKSIQEVESRFLRTQEEVARRNRSKLVDDFLDAADKKDGVKVQELAKEMAEAGVTLDAIKSAARGRKIEPQLRLFKSLSKGAKAREAERFVPDHQSQH